VTVRAETSLPTVALISTNFAFHAREALNKVEFVFQTMAMASCFIDYLLQGKEDGDKVRSYRISQIRHIAILEFDGRVPWATMENLRSLPNLRSLRFKQRFMRKGFGMKSDTKMDKLSRVNYISRFITRFICKQTDIFFDPPAMFGNFSGLSVPPGIELPDPKTTPDWRKGFIFEDLDPAREIRLSKKTVWKLTEDEAQNLWKMMDVSYEDHKLGNRFFRERMERERAERQQAEREQAEKEQAGISSRLLHARGRQ
jgi:hypothetical protein